MLKNYLATGTAVVIREATRKGQKMTETIKMIFLFEVILIANVILAFVIWKFRKNKIEESVFLMDDMLLNEESRAQYDDLIKSETALSLSLGQEASESVSCPSFFHYIGEKNGDNWSLTS